MPRMLGNNRCIEIEYADTGGVISQRKVNVSLFYRPEWASFWYIEGFCNLRGEQRTFRTDRMLRLWDGPGGWAQVPGPSEWVESLWSSPPQWNIDPPPPRREAQRKTVEPGIRSWGRHSILGNTWGEERSAAIRKEQMDRERFEEEVHSIVTQHFHALRALIYVAKADKAFRSAEKRQFNLFFTRTAGHRMDTRALRERCMIEAARIDPPTTGQFYYSVRQLIPRTKKYRMAICATAKAMINSDKTVASYEIKVFDYLVRKLKPFDD